MRYPLLLSFCFTLLTGCWTSLERVNAPIQLQGDKLAYRVLPKLKGVSLAVLEGDPVKPGLYTIRLKAPAGFSIGSHTHTGHERVTVLTGSITVAFPEGGPPETTFNTGDYYVNPAGVVHRIAAGPQGVTVQVTGIGPWQTELVKKAE